MKIILTYKGAPIQKISREHITTTADKTKMIKFNNVEEAETFLEAYPWNKIWNSCIKIERYYGKVSLEDRKTIGETLKKIRLSRGLSQREIAESVNIERSTYAYYERGTTVPDILKLAKIASVFNVKLYCLLESVLTEEELKTIF